MFKVIRLRLEPLIVAGAVALCVCTAAAAVGSGEKIGKDEKTSSDSRELPIIMYHSVVNDSSYVGDYVITKDEFESDLRYISDMGYTPVFCSEVADFVNGEGDLPDKPIIISFDDGSYNNFYYVTPLLEKYHFKAVFAIVGKWCEFAAEEASPSTLYSYADLDDLTSMVNSGYCEIANHTYDMHNLESRKGILRLDGESEREYRVTLYNDITQNQRLLERLGERPKVFVYPYGFCDEESEEIISQLGFEVTLGCEEKVNQVSVGDYGCLKNLGRFNRSSGNELVMSEKLGVRSEE